MRLISQNKISIEYIEMNNKQYNKDKKYGALNENIVLNILRKKYGDVKKFENKYSIFDYYIEDINSNTKINNKRVSVLFELKSRRNTIDKFNTQLIGQNKIDKAKNLLSKDNQLIVIILYKLNSEIYSYTLEKDKEFKTCRLGNFARGSNAEDLYLIPNDLLEKINFVENDIKEFLPPTSPITLNFT